MNDEEAQQELQPKELIKNDSVMMQVIRAELDDLVATSTAWRQQASSAKTNTKRDLFKKKLAKNNKRVMEMLVAFERIKAAQPAQSSLDISEDVESDIIEESNESTSEE